MQKERVLVTVKTYPTMSAKYGETVCTAGIREDGTWVRIYPVPFRRLVEDERYGKYDWIEGQFQKSSKDYRPESLNPVDVHDLKKTGHIGTSDKWSERRRLVLETSKVYENLEELILDAKNKDKSLAVFKPTKVTDFVWEQEEREWNPQKIRSMNSMLDQSDLFEDNSWREEFRHIPKLPFSFSYCFEDVKGKASKLQILDWEIGQLYWNCLHSTQQCEPDALAKVRSKYFDEFLKKDLHFFLGTTLRFHKIAPNPWVIIGVFPIPHETQKRLI